MPEPNVFNTISARARRLLDRAEGLDVEFKESLSGLDAADMVAFANSEAGGAILVGVEEVTSRDGRQTGRVIGCGVGDREKQSIISRAESCTPPVPVTVFVENAHRRPFLRVEIASGASKPYCTAGGTYKTRGDGRSLALFPGRLLCMFVDVEGRRFMERFRQATTALENEVTAAKARLASDLRELALEVSASLEQVSGSAQAAEEMSNQTAAFSDETLGGMHEIDRKVENIEVTADRNEHKLLAILEHLGIEDPVLAVRRENTRALIRLMLENGGRSKRKMIEAAMERWPESERANVEQWYAEVREELKKQGKLSRPRRPRRGAK
jgi:hypothetical protein